MGNFMSTPKSSENQISSQSRPLPSRTDAAHLSSAVRNSNRVDTCKAIHCNKRRIADGHNLKHVMGQPSNYPAHLPLNMASCSIFGEYSRAPKQQQKLQPSPPPPPPAPPGAPDHPRCSARDTRMKRVMIHDNGMQPGDGRGFYRQGTPHPTRKRLSVNSAVLDARGCGDDRRGADVARANTRFNATHSESEGSKYSEDTTMSECHSDTRSSDVSASEESLHLDSESQESLEFAAETPMSVDIPADMTMAQEAFDGTKIKREMKQDPPDSNRTRRKPARVPKQRRRVSNMTDYSMTDVEMREASSIAPQDFIKPNLPPPMESPPTPTGQRSVRVSGRKRKATPMQPTTPAPSAAAAAANAASTTPKRQRRTPGRPKAATPLVPEEPPAEAASAGECGGGGGEEPVSAPDTTPKASDCGGDDGDGGGGGVEAPPTPTEIAAM